MTKPCDACGRDVDEQKAIRIQAGEYVFVACSIACRDLLLEQEVVEELEATPDDRDRR